MYRVVMMHYHLHQSIKASKHQSIKEERRSLFTTNRPDDETTKEGWTRRETEESDETRKDVANRSSIPKHRCPIYLSEGARCGAS